METVKTPLTIDAPELLQNVEEQGMTIIHCRYTSKTIYVNGGWVNIFKTCYLVNPLGGKLQLLHSENIPVAPDRHFFQRKGQMKRFTLYFPSIPESWEVFDFMEDTGNGKTGFTVHGLKRNKIGVYEVTLV